MGTLIDQAVELLNAESRRLYGEPLDAEQLEACFNEDQVFAMIDDMEARMGFDVTEARYLLACHFEGEEY
jgi:hypothetical protein